MTLYPTQARAKFRRLATGRLISVTGGAAAYTALNFTVWSQDAFALGCRRSRCCSPSASRGSSARSGARSATGSIDAR